MQSVTECPHIRPQNSGSQGTFSGLSIKSGMLFSSRRSADQASSSSTLRARQEIRCAFWRERRAGRCEAPRRRRCRWASARSGNKADARPPPRPSGLRPAGPLAVLLAPYIPQRVCSSLAPCQRAWGPAAKCTPYFLTGPKENLVMRRLACVVWFVCLFFGCVCLLARAAQSTFDYRVLATNKTSTMEKEMKEAADGGFEFGAVMGGETAGGGKEVVVVMVKDPSKAQGDRRVYKLLATSKTSTMQKEMQQLGDEGFEYMGQTVFESAFGGKEVVVIMERDA